MLIDPKRMDIRETMEPQEKFHHFFKTRVHSFGYAFQGLGFLLRTQRNAWIHAVATVCAVSVSIWLPLSRIEWGLVIVAITLVWMAEAFNTAVEALVDLYSPKRHSLAKVAKDCAAGGVLIAAVGAAVIGFVVFLPHLLAFF